MEGFIVLFVVAVFVLGIKWFVSYDKSREAEEEPLLGYEKCSPQFQAYMRKEIKAGRAKPQKYPQADYERATYTEDKNKTYKGKRGGKYTKGKTKDGRPYRRYF